MALVLTALLHPLFEQLDLFRRGLAMRIGGRHAFIGVCGGDAIDELALSEVARHDGARAAFPFRPRIRLAIQSQLGLACRAVRPVALVAVVGEDGPDVAIKT